ncbi:hypothetical protein Tco_0600572 [Tanacetum coccineum]
MVRLGTCSHEPTRSRRDLHRTVPLVGASNEHIPTNWYFKKSLAEKTGSSTYVVGIWLIADMKTSIMRPSVSDFNDNLPGHSRSLKGLLFQFLSEIDGISMSPLNSELDDIEKRKEHPSDTKVLTHEDRNPSRAYIKQANCLRNPVKEILQNSTVKGSIIITGNRVVLATVFNESEQRHFRLFITNVRCWHLCDGMLVYCDRENARDLEFANGLYNLWVELLERTNERQQFITELEGLCSSAKRYEILECLN